PQTLLTSWFLASPSPRKFPTPSGTTNIPFSTVRTLGRAWFVSSARSNPSGLFKKNPAALLPGFLFFDFHGCDLAFTENSVFVRIRRRYVFRRFTSHYSQRGDAPICSNGFGPA